MPKVNGSLTGYLVKPSKVKYQPPPKPAESNVNIFTAVFTGIPLKAATNATILMISSRSVTAKGFESKYSFGYDSDFKEDAGYWINELICTYYEVDSISGVPMEEWTAY